MPFIQNITKYFTSIPTICSKMGIRGLTSYIESHSDIYYRPYKLHDSRLVIDGSSLIYQLCNTNGTDYAFGGDYDSMAQSIDNFFAKLAKCNVDPFVIFDGGIEQKKFKTTLKRVRLKVTIGANYHPAIGCNNTFLPMNLKQVAMSVMAKRNVFFASAMFEADSEIAAVAKTLECPVLSLDSDFYIYDVAYIPWNTLEGCCHINSKKKKGTSAMKCKIYRLENLLGNFEGMDKSVVPMIAVLLGNDYIRRNEITSYGPKAVITGNKVKGRKNLLNRVHKVLTSLRDQSLGKVIAKVLGRVRHENKERSIALIEMVINCYINLYPRILLDLELPQEYIGTQDFPRPKVFRYSKSMEDSESASEDSMSESEKEEEEEDVINEDHNDESNDQEDVIDKEDHNDEDNDQNDSEDEEEQIQESTNEFQVIMEDSIHQVLPEWFIRQFRTARYPSSVMDMLTKRLYIGIPQIEDFSYPAVAESSLNLVKTIYAIVSSGIPNQQSPPCLQYYHRDDKRSISCSSLDASEVQTQLPTLHQLQDLSFDQRKKIIDETLQVSLELEQFPEKWRLYIASLIFWLRQDAEPQKTNCHVYAFLFGMLFGLMDAKIGYQRRALYFQKKSDASTKTVENLAVATTISEAIEQITERDCYFLGKFLIPYFAIAEDVLEKKNKFNVTIIHCFNQFQDCLKYAIALNALLGFLYQEPEIEALYNGTLLYNLFTNFQRRGNIDIYAELVLKDAPSFSRIFKMLVEKVGSICEQHDIGVFQNLGNKSKRRKKNRKKKTVDSEESEDEIEDCDEEIFCDMNNPFYLLQS